MCLFNLLAGFVGVERVKSCEPAAAPSVSYFSFYRCFSTTVQIYSGIQTLKMTEVKVQVMSTTIVCRFDLKCIFSVRVCDFIRSVLEAEGLLVRAENVFSVWFGSPTEETDDFQNKQQQSG